MQFQFEKNHARYLINQARFDASMIVDRFCRLIRWNTRLISYRNSILVAIKLLISSVTALLYVSACCSAFNT